jgi:PIN domain nuclease of toxin-antitoxin system
VILLDTHVLVWWLAEPAKIPSRATRAIAAAVRDKEPIGVSSISIWEIAMLVERGRLAFTMDLDAWLTRVESLPFFQFLPVDNHVAIQSVRLEDFPHRDPADRIIVATAISHGAELLTGDTTLQKYRGVKTVWG